MSLAHQIVRVEATVPAPISPATARLPENYEKARRELAACASIDECLTWGDKAAALASYAKQANDDELMNMATRIRDRAIRRAGELLKQVDPGHGARDGKREVGAHPPLRGEVASDAGMSPHQAKQAVRVANVPAADFECQVESVKPPTVTALAEQGKKSAPAPAPARAVIPPTGRSASSATSRNTQPSSASSISTPFCRSCLRQKPSACARQSLPSTRCTIASSRGHKHYAAVLPDGPVPSNRRRCSAPLTKSQGAPLRSPRNLQP